MTMNYIYCSPNNFLAYLQPEYGRINWSISELLMFLRCLPIDYIIYDNEIRSKDGNYYIVYDVHLGGIFYVFF